MRSSSHALKVRYIFAGLIIPIILLSYLSYAIYSKNLHLLGLAGNAMAFFVGWHYVKQGFGILIIDSVSKKAFFTETEKNKLKVNSYTCWLFFWLLANQKLSQLSIWNVEYYTFNTPTILTNLFAALLIITTIQTIMVLYTKFKNNLNCFPLSGVMAYILSCYIWIGIKFNPLLFIFVPAMHSLQYIYIVLKVEGNRCKSLFKEHKLRLTLFVFLGFGIGYYGFWVIPNMLEEGIELDDNVFKSGTFLFATWVFINIHHYFIDNVIWKKDNPETSKYLFNSSKNNNSKT